jgi:hypothetical protein
MKRTGLSANERTGTPACDAVDIVEEQRLVGQNLTQRFERGYGIGRAFAEGGAPALTNIDNIQPLMRGADVLIAKVLGEHVDDLLGVTHNPKRSRHVFSDLSYVDVDV